MGRAPCCEKMGLKKGPWTAEEDHILINYINRYGHGNWRALPKQAGLLRCGKSCRLRWTNYLRPDIKRGNFSKEEEETIIKLHEMMGNRWSAIAARLPRRTDNEIKNVWHTHLKKRLKPKETTLELTNPPESIKMEKYDQVMEKEPKPINNYANQVGIESPQRSASYTSSVTTTTTTTTTSDNTTTTSMNDNYDAFDNFLEVNENFWSDVFSGDNSSKASDFLATSGDQQVQFQFQLSSPLEVEEYYCGNNSSLHDGMDYWFNMYTTTGELPELPQF